MENPVLHRNFESALFLCAYQECALWNFKIFANLIGEIESSAILMNINLSTGNVELWVHLLISYTYFLFCDVSVCIICPFYLEVFSFLLIYKNSLHISKISSIFCHAISFPKLSLTLFLIWVQLFWFGSSICSQIY